MLSASQARSTAEANKARYEDSVIEDVIRYKVKLGEFMCHFSPEQEQQVRKVLAGKGYNIKIKSCIHDNWISTLHNKTAPKEVEVFFIEVTW